MTQKNVKVIISSGKDHSLTEKDAHYLKTFHQLFEVHEYLYGDCPAGVDEFAKNHLEMELTKFPANWNQLGLAADPIRNREMADYANVLIAFKGTADMIKAAQSRYLLIFDLRNINET